MSCDGHFASSLAVEYLRLYMNIEFKRPPKVGLNNLNNPTRAAALGWIRGVGSRQIKKIIIVNYISF